MFFLKKPCTINLEIEPRNQDGFDCTHCARPVYDVSRWTESKFERFLKEHEGKDTPCMRVLADSDGALLFRKEESSLKKRMLPILAASTLAACQPDPAPELLPIAETHQPHAPSKAVPATAETAPPLNIGAPDRSNQEINEAQVVAGQASGLVRSRTYTVTVNSNTEAAHPPANVRQPPRRMAGRMHRQPTPMEVNQTLAQQPADTDNEITE